MLASKQRLSGFLGKDPRLSQTLMAGQSLFLSLLSLKLTPRGVHPLPGDIPALLRDTGSPSFPCLAGCRTTLTLGIWVSQLQLGFPSSGLGKALERFRSLLLEQRGQEYSRDQLAGRSGGTGITYEVNGSLWNILSLHLLSDLLRMFSVLQVHPSLSQSLS